MKSEIKKTLKDRLEAVHASKWYPSYHISADIGWISDPNGLSFHNGLYHIFHQYTLADDLNLSKA